jgi:hypothetical protein
MRFIADSARGGKILAHIIHEMLKLARSASQTAVAAASLAIRNHEHFQLLNCSSAHLLCPNNELFGLGLSLFYTTFFCKYPRFQC